MHFRLVVSNLLISDSLYDRTIAIPLHDQFTISGLEVEIFSSQAATVRT